jgi:uracil-DNA glycosylase family 4
VIKLEDTKDQILELVMQADPANPLQYVHSIVKDYARNKLDLAIAECKDCSISGLVKTLTAGNSNAAVMIIADTVSEEQVSKIEENVYQLPLCDSSGETFDKALDALHVNKDQLFYINSVNCWPYKEVGTEAITRTPTKKETECCKVFVHHAIEIVQPLVIITLGNIALNLFIKESISKARGEWFDYKGIPLMPTYHPGYFDKITGHKDEEMIQMLQWDFFGDLQKAFNYVVEKYPDIKMFEEVNDESDNGN